MLVPGQKLGPYEVHEAIGAGGMGEVYRARDGRLGRNVALKVLPAERARDADRLRRFENEARALAALSHPNILAVHDVGLEGGIAYVVFELLEGRTLRRALESGPLPPRRVIEHAIQVCRGLAAAHEKGILHRDLKPENLLLTREGQLKILDFGLAKLVQGDGASSAETSTTTEAGLVLGTAGYMSPEQARGRAVDERSDLFSLGAVLYEMISGGRAFAGESAADTISAILHRDPPAITTAAAAVPAGLETVVRRCLEKDPRERFQSARDVAFALEAVTGSSRAETTPAPNRLSPRRALAAAALLAVVTLTGVVSFLAGRRSTERSLPRFTRVTSGRGLVGTARFTADGSSVVYAARWGEGEWDVFRQRIDSPLAHPLQLGRAEPVSAHAGDIALVVDRPPDRPEGPAGLVRASVDGGPAREMLESVLSADWGPDGRELAIVRQPAQDVRRLEFPVGRVLRESSGLGLLRSVRVSPQGDLVALADLPNGVTDAEGSVIVLDRSGRERVRSGPWRSLGGLAWSPDGREVWLSASGDGRPRTLHAVDLSGRERPLFSGPGGLDIEDVRADGRVLVRRSHLRAEVRGRLRGDEAERDLSLSSYTVAPSLLPDGGAIGLLTSDESTGRPGAYLWRAGEAVPVRLADSGLYSLSPDGRTALCSESEAGRPRDFTLVPTGPGEPRALTRGSIDRYQWGFFGTDSRHVVFNAQEKGRPRRLFIQDTGGGDPRPLTPEGVAFELPRMTTTHVLSRNMDDPGDPWRLYPLDGGEPRPMPWLRAGDWPLAWDREGATLFLAESLAFPLRVLRLDVASGARRPWLETRPPDETAVIGPVGMELASDGCCYVYTYLREPGELFLVDGLH